ncbi:hypothetical protein [Psychromonas aquimarina]|uniref:hypothetical protein n=1 Tax=Psychromonas aquimarina TaxID=444919 RepID=UPI0004908B59|nr:hypothetical protein [Psychromonas aquimarina]
MQDIPFYVWHFILLFSSIILWAIAIFTFGRISVRHIEREMEKKGLEPPFWDRGIGIRLSMYAFTIIRGKADHSVLIDRKSIVESARKIDWYLAVFLQLTTAVLFILGIITYFLSGDKYQ